MTDFIGTADKDQLSGTNARDTFDMSQGGNDKVFGRSANDTFNFGAELGKGDKIDGGTGNDLLVLDGDYSSKLTFLDTTLISVEGMRLTAGHSYSFEFTDANIDRVLSVDGRGLGAGDVLTVDARADTDGFVTALGGAGNDVLRTGAGNDTFVLSKGGADLASGGDGTDRFDMGAAFDVGDRIDGGLGSDRLTLEGNYANGFTITKAMIDNVEEIRFAGNVSYNVVIGNKVTDGILTIDASEVGGGHRVVVDARAEKTTGISFLGSAGDDGLIGGDGTDTMDMSQGGNDHAIGRNGGDVFNFGGALTSADRIDGGDGFDSLTLNGNYVGGLTFNPNTIRSIEQITLFAGNDYTLTVDDANVAAGALLAITGSGLGTGQRLVFDGTAELDGSLSVTGGSAGDLIDGGAGDDVLGGGVGIDVLNGHDGDDLLVGGTFGDTLNGGAGMDRMNGGDSDDTFIYTAVSESTGATRDTILNFDALTDKIDLTWAVTDVDEAVTDGTLSEATFDTDLTAAIGADELASNHAVLFTADAGDLSTHTFLIVEHGGGAGYQAGQDLVIEIEAGTNLVEFDDSVFI